MHAFEKAEEDLHEISKEGAIRYSGSTGLAVLLKGDRIWSANCGDCRCVIASETEETVIFAATDHSFELEEEKRRVLTAGGEIEQGRVYKPGKTVPALNVSRSLGDAMAKRLGVIATPEVVMTEVDLTKKIFLIVATDGVWQFLTSAKAAKAMATSLKGHGPAHALALLQESAAKLWSCNAEYQDDVTPVLVQLPA